MTMDRVEEIELEVRRAFVPRYAALVASPMSIKQRLRKMQALQREEEEALTAAFRAEKERVDAELATLRAERAELRAYQWRATHCAVCGGELTEEEIRQAQWEDHLRGHPGTARQDAGQRHG
jgi:DNA repair exonuclease SbcCD ATPase subunit